MFKWHDESIEMLKDMWVTKGASDTQIAVALGREFPTRGEISRSSVIGKRHRLKLGVEHQPARKVSTGGRPRPGVLKPPSPDRPDLKHRVSRKQAEQRREEALRRDFRLDVVELKCEAVGLLGLTVATCRWPMDDGVLYCGNRTINYRGKNEASPYCHHHYALAYVGPKVFRSRDAAAA